MSTGKRCLPSSQGLRGESPHGGTRRRRHRVTKFLRKQLDNSVVLVLCGRQNSLISRIVGSTLNSIEDSVYWMERPETSGKKQKSQERQAQRGSNKVINTSTPGMGGRGKEGGGNRREGLECAGEKRSGRHQSKRNTHGEPVANVDNNNRDSISARHLISVMHTYEVHQHEHVHTPTRTRTLHQHQHEVKRERERDEDDFTSNGIERGPEG